MDCRAQVAWTLSPPAWPPLCSIPILLGSWAWQTSLVSHLFWAPQICMLTAWPPCLIWLLGRLHTTAIQASWLECSSAMRKSVSCAWECRCKMTVDICCEAVLSCCTYICQSHWSNFGQDQQQQHASLAFVVAPGHFSFTLQEWGLVVGWVHVISVDCFPTLRLFFNTQTVRCGFFRISGLSVDLAFVLLILDNTLLLETISFKFEISGLKQDSSGIVMQICMCSSLTLIVFTNEEHSDKDCRLTLGACLYCRQHV